MKQLSSILLLLLVSLNFGCRKNCESEQVGEINLNDTSKKYTPYQNSETLTFVNEQGQEIVFTNEVVEESYRICTQFLCENTSDPFDQTPCEYYQAQGIRNLLRTNSIDTLLIEMVVSTENYESESTLFYDLFSVHMSKIGPLTRGQFIPHIGFTNPVLNEANTIITDPMIEVDEIELMGEIYTNVIYTDYGELGDQHAIYIKKEVGIIFILLDGVLWRKAI